MKNVDPKYCWFCGKSLIDEPKEYRFNTATGERFLYKESRKCFSKSAGVHTLAYRFHYSTEWNITET